MKLLRNTKILAKLPRLRGKRPNPVNRPRVAKSRRQLLKTILVPIDFSECSKKALEYALKVARQFTSELTLLNVVQPYLPVPEMTMVDVGMLQRQMVKAASVQIEELGNEVRATWPCKTLIRTGNPAIEIVKAARELGSGAIVIATHGRGGISHFLLGSTTEKVIRHAECPVVVVRDQVSQNKSKGKPVSKK